MVRGSPGLKIVASRARVNGARRSWEFTAAEEMRSAVGELDALMAVRAGRDVPTGVRESHALARLPQRFSSYGGWARSLHVPPTRRRAPTCGTFAGGRDPRSRILSQVLDSRGGRDWLCSETCCTGQVFNCPVGDLVAVDLADRPYPSRRSGPSRSIAYLQQHTQAFSDHVVELGSPEADGLPGEHGRFAHVLIRVDPQRRQGLHDPNGLD